MTTTKIRWVLHPAGHRTLPSGKRVAVFEAIDIVSDYQPPRPAGILGTSGWGNEPLYIT